MEAGARGAITELAHAPRGLSPVVGSGVGIGVRGAHGSERRRREQRSADVSPASFSAQNFGKFSSDHHETPSSSIVANKDDLESRDNVLEKSLRSNVAKFRFT